MGRRRTHAPRSDCGKFLDVQLQVLQLLPAARHSRHFVVNYLLAGRGELSNRFASREQERWTDVAWRPTACGLPWLHADSLAYAECSLVQEVDGGDHVILIGRVDGGQPP